MAINMAIFVLARLGYCFDDKSPGQNSASILECNKE